MHEAQSVCGRFWKEVERRWPQVRVDQAAWLAVVAEKLGDAQWGELAKLHGSDLALATAALAGDDTAIQALAATVEPHAAVLRSRHGSAQVDDALQETWTGLLSGEQRLKDYSGRGPLRAWLEVTLSRKVIDQLRSRARRDEPAPPEDFLSLEADVHDPELRYLKERYQLEFKQSFEAAAATLTPEERNALRLHFSKRLTIDQIATLIGVHRATAARRVAKAREVLVQRTAQHLSEKLQLSQTEYDSLVRLVQSQLEFSVERVLGSITAAG